MYVYIRDLLISCLHCCQFCEFNENSRLDFFLNVNLCVRCDCLRKGLIIFHLGNLGSDTYMVHCKQSYLKIPCICIYIYVCEVMLEFISNIKLRISTNKQGFHYLFTKFAKCYIITIQTCIILAKYFKDIQDEDQSEFKSFLKTYFSINHRFLHHNRH